MSKAFDVEVSDRATPAVQQLMAKATPRALGEVVWPPALELTQRHLSAWKNTKGFPSQGFGEQLANQSLGTATDDGAKIAVHGQGARLLFSGGTIKPVTRRTLCFPIAAESYGKSLPEMFGGAVPPRAQRSPADNAKLKALRRLFAFAPQVTIQPHPEMLPTSDEYGGVALKAIGEAIEGGFFHE